MFSSAKASIRRRIPNTYCKVICSFTPAWFAMIMGTGSISLLLDTFPYGNDTLALRMLTLIVFFSNLVLFTVFLLISVARYTIYDKILSDLLRDPVQSMYISTFPMSITTLINIAVSVHERYTEFGRKPFLYAIWAIWWVDVGLSVVCCLGLTHLMQTRQTHTLESMTPLWIFPVITLVVASSSGGGLAVAMEEYSPSHALFTVGTSVVMVTIGLALSFTMLSIYSLRLTVHGLPKGATILSVFLPLGPTGQGGLCFLLVGKSLQSLLPLANPGGTLIDVWHSSTTAGDTINVLCICIAFCLWALGTMWMISALISVLHVLRHTKFPFKVPFWGIVFPNGSYAILSISLGQTLNSEFFRIYGAMWAGVTLILWTGVLVRTVMLVHNGRIFDSACLTDVDVTQALRRTLQQRGNPPAVVYKTGTTNSSSISSTPLPT